MHSILFQIGPITLYTYGFFVFLGVLSGYWISTKHARHNGIDPIAYGNIIFWTIIWAFIGARLLYIAIEWPAFIKNPLAIGLSRSGFVFYGGFIAGFCAFYLLSRRYKIFWLKLADSAAIGLALGYAFGRIGCFFHGCCYGRSTYSWLGILFPADSPAGIAGEKVIPTQLLSSAAMFIVFWFLISRRPGKPGKILALYLITESAVRFSIEILRGDPRGQWGIFSTSQWIAVVLFILGLKLWKKISREK